MKTPHCKEYVLECLFYWCGENPSHCSASGGVRGQKTPSIIKNMCLNAYSIIHSHFIYDYSHNISSKFQ